MEGIEKPRRRYWEPGDPPRRPVGYRRPPDPPAQHIAGVKEERHEVLKTIGSLVLFFGYWVAVAALPKPWGVLGIFLWIALVLRTWWRWIKAGGRSGSGVEYSDRATDQYCDDPGGDC